MDEIVVISNNSVSERGSFDELISHNGAFAEFIRTYLKECSAGPEVEEEGQKTLNSNLFSTKFVNFSPVGA